MAILNANLTAEAAAIADDRRQFHQSRGGKLLALQLVEFVDYGPAAKLEDVAGDEIQAAGAARKLASNGRVFRQVASVGQVPGEYFSPN